MSRTYTRAAALLYSAAIMSRRITSGKRGSGVRMSRFPVLIALLFASTSLSAQLPANVLTQSGMVEGAVSNNPAVMVYKGLPYAAPPVGENRWRAPQPAPAWSGVRNATEYGPRCVQNGFAPGAEQPLTSEDCLYLNVWAPV